NPEPRDIARPHPSAETASTATAEQECSLPPKRTSRWSRSTCLLRTPWSARGSPERTGSDGRSRRAKQPVRARGASTPVGARALGRPTPSELKAGGRGHHGRSACVYGRDDLLNVDAPAGRCSWCRD